MSQVLTAQGRARATGSRSRARSRALLAPTLVLMLIAVGGRYTLDRAGIAWLAWLDLRLVGLALVLALVYFDLRRVRDLPTSRRRPEGWLVAATLFLLYQAASGLWAPAGARVGAEVLDVVCIALLLIATYLHARSDPLVVIRRVLWFLWATALVYALGAFAASPGAQGRFAAFGGGPNVFVRIELLGVVAALALRVHHRSRWLTASCAPLLVAALLSGSRGGLLAGAVVALALVLRSRRVTRRTAVAGAVAAVAVLGGAYLFLPPVRTLVDTRFIAQTVDQGYASGRPQIWQQALQLFTSHPVIGSGLDGFYALVGASTGTEYPHNLLLAIAAEGGAAGLFLFGTTIALWVGTVRRAVVRSVELTASVASAAMIAIAGLFSGDYYDARLAWIFAALAAAVATASTSRALAGGARSAGARSVGLRAGGET